MSRILSVLLATAISLGCLAQNKNINLLGTYTYGSTEGNCSDIWGHVDSLGNEYAIVGNHNGTSVMNIQNPANPRQIYYKPGATTIWRDIKTYKNYAYVTNEQDSGLLILDLRHLPDSSTIQSYHYTGVTYPFKSAHNLYIDEKGYCYLFGADYSNKGVIILDLNSNPINPTEVGIWDSYYVHDGVARGDTLWVSAISNGFQGVLDVSNKSSITQYTNWATPSNFTHNCWFSDDNKYLFTTDEVSGAYLAAYDVSNLSNVTEIDRVQSSPGSGVIPHNTHYINGYLVTSYYRDGVTIHDVQFPGNMIEVGNYDSSPLSGNGFNGCWGAYPWLPSGNLIISDIENHLFILGPNYKRGCYVDGTVTNLSTGDSIPGALIEILTQPQADANSNLQGYYQTGVADSGTYNIAFSAGGFYPDTAYNVTLTNGVWTTVNMGLIPQTPMSFSGRVVESGTNVPVSYAKVRLQNQYYTYDVQTNFNGVFNVPTMFEGKYNITAGQWEYYTKCLSQVTLLASTPQPYRIELDKGYYDDFSFDFNWITQASATTGLWERGEPFGTSLGSDPSNPDFDVNNDCLDQAFVTGNAAQAQAGNDDIDGGEVVLTSPIFNLSTYNDPYLHYSRWFYNGGGGSQVDDTMKIQLTDGSTTITLETITAQDSMSQWVDTAFQLFPLIQFGTQMQLIVTAGDYGQGHIVEAALDHFYIEEKSTIGVAENTAFEASVFPNPSNEAFGIQWASRELTKVEVITVSGQLLESQNVAGSYSTTVGENLSAGIYLVRFVSASGDILGNQKLVKY